MPKRQAYFPKSPPPTAAKIALIKIWKEFDRQLVKRGYDIQKLRGEPKKKGRRLAS
jgi:hypothetical protein